MAYGRRKKGGQKLLELSKKRRQTAAKSKAGKLKPMVIEPSLSKLRVSKGQAKGKGGSALKALSKTKAAAKKAVSKPMAKTRSQAARNVAAGSKARTPSAATRRQARANIARADKNTKNRQELAALKKAGNKGSWTDFIPQMSVKKAQKIGDALTIGGALVPAGRGLRAAGRLIKGASKTKPNLYKKATAAKKQQDLRKVADRVSRNKGATTTTPKSGNKKFQERKRAEKRRGNR